MTVATNRGGSATAGLFATSRRGGLTALEAQAVREMRAKKWGWQTIANVLGRVREDVQVIEVANDAGQPVGGPQPRPFAWTDKTLEESERLFSDGKGAKTIALAVGCPLNVAEARYGLLRRRARQ